MGAMPCLPWATTGLALTVALAGACTKEEPGTQASSATSSTASLYAPAPGIPSASFKPIRVGLDGRIAGKPDPDSIKGERVYAQSPRVWILERPDTKSPSLGYLRVGGSVLVRASATKGSGCAGLFVPVQPRGYICVDDRAATTRLSDPLTQFSQENPPLLDRKLPYVYGTVRRPGPVYSRLPRPAELEGAEPDLTERMERWLKAEGEIGASYAPEVWLAGRDEVSDPARAWSERTTDPSIPGWLTTESSRPLISGRNSPRLGYSFLRTFLYQGRRYGVTPQAEVVPVDRLRPIRGSDFHGYRIPEEIGFPFALVRQPGARFYHYDEKSGRLSSGPEAPYRGAIRLTGKQAFFRTRLHYETVDGSWLSDRDASRLDPVRRMPAWGKAGEKWMDINVTKQTLVLYEGTRPVYATFVSTGEAGLEDPESSSATQRGIFRIHTKHVSVTMDSDEAGEEFELRDVPYVQYFEKGYALHGAYWHDRFGIPKSHGCINLAPEDARRIFSWTEPAVPLGWHGALLPLKGTILFVHP